MYKKITVGKDNTGDFDTIRAAVDSVDGKAEIFIKNGFYFEKVIIDKPDVVLTGEDRENTVIVYNDCALRKKENGEFMDTFETASVEVRQNAVNTRIENLTIQNSAGYGKIVGQAVALNVMADKTVVKNCRLIARQDTLMLWPCFKEALADPDIYVRSYFENCYIEGDVDFIFGGACAVFKNCDIFCKHRPVGYNCYVTAACTPANLKHGLVFFDCSIDGDADSGTVYLGRPWTEGAKTVFINTKASDVLSKDIWSKWGKTIQHDPSLYAQNSFDAGFDVPAWSKLLSDAETKEYTPENILGDWEINA